MVGGATSKLDLPSLTQLSIAGCGRLQLGVPYWAARVYYCKQLIIDPAYCGRRFYTGRLLAIEDFIFYLYHEYWMAIRTMRSFYQCEINYYFPKRMDRIFDFTHIVKFGK